MTAPDPLQVAREALSNALREYAVQNPAESAMRGQVASAHALIDIAISLRVLSGRSPGQ